jgi:hypothetical protein
MGFDSIAIPVAESHEMTEPAVPISRARQVLDALLPYALVVPLFTVVAFVASAAVAVLGIGGIVGSFVQMLRELAHLGPVGHGYGILAALVLWAALLATGAAALVLFVVVATSFAASFGVIVSGLIDLARVPRALPPEDHRWPKRVGGWTAALAALGSIVVAARADTLSLGGVRMFFCALGGAVATLGALAVGHVVSRRARRRSALPEASSRGL